MWDFLEYADNACLIDEHGSILTYGDLWSEENRLWNVVGHRCLVFCLCKNEIGAVVGYVSFIEHRVVPVLLNSNLDQELLDSLIKTYKPAYLWLPKDLTDSFPNMAVSYEAWDYVLIKTHFQEEYPLYDELCLMLTTSGSTGSPKFVRQSYANVRDNALSIVKYLKLTADERPITTLPMNYTYGLSIINSHFFVGAALLVTEKGLMQKEFWSFFKEQQATSFGGVPYTYEMLDKLRFYRMNLPSLKYMTQAGGKITLELHKKFAEYAVKTEKKFIVMYGQCEATARMGYLPSEMALEKCGSMGISIPGGSFYLIDENGQHITEPFATGELVYEGTNVTLGYAECGKDLIKGDEREGVLQTGDMAQMDDDGYYYIVGRKKRFLKIYGNRVNLDEIDRMIKGHFNHVDCASAGIDDHMYLFITDQAVADGVKEFVVSKTKLNPAAFKTIVIDEIPKSAAGKTLYKELTKYYQ